MHGAHRVFCGKAGIVRYLTVNDQY